MDTSLVIIPTYNEAENIHAIIDAVMGLTSEFHVLIVDDGSPDGTADMVVAKSEEFVGRVHLMRRSGKLGLGTAYIAGFRWALERDYALVYEMDADFSHNPEDLERLREACIEGADMAIGSRYVKGVNVVNWPMGRVLMSYFASKYVRLITGLPIHDATAGFVAYRRHVLEQIRLDEIQFIGYAFQIEMKFKAWKLQFNLVEVPVIFTERQHGNSKMSSGIFREAVIGVISMKLKSIFKPIKASNRG